MFATDRTSSNEKIALFSGNFIACWISKATMPTNGTRLTVSLTLFLTSVTTSCIAQVGPAQDSPPSATASRLAYTEKINKTYSFPFGKGHIVLPGNAAVASGGFLDPEHVSQCGLLWALPPAGISRMAPVPPLQFVQDPVLQQERGDSGSYKGNRLRPVL